MQVTNTQLSNLGTGFGLILDQSEILMHRACVADCYSLAVLALASACQ